MAGEPGGRVAEGGGIGSVEGLATESGPSSPFSPAPPTPPPDEPSICQFLASRARDGTLGPAVPAVDPVNHCIAVGEPAPQFPQQQHLVCLAAAHVNCPRYLRGMLLAGAPPPPPARDPVSPTVIGAALVLLAAIAASFGFLAIRGGFDLAVSTADPGQLAVAATPSVAPSVAITAAPVPTSTPSPSLPPSPIPSATPSSAPSSTPEATPRPTLTPAATSDRFAVLTKCPSTPDCWIYTIRSGDNLESIANWFGVSYDKVLAMNPNLRRPIQPGDQLRIPTPTR
jgi:hypothetical protein